MQIFKAEFLTLALDVLIQGFWVSDNPTHCRTLRQTSSTLNISLTRLTYIILLIFNCSLG